MSQKPRCLFGAIDRESHRCSLAAVDALARLARARPSWHRLAACRGHAQPELWFPVKGQPTKPAKTICATCPALTPCLDWALAEGPELEGVWAGTSRQDRKRIRQQAA